MVRHLRRERQHRNHKIEPYHCKGGFLRTNTKGRRTLVSQAGGRRRRGEMNLTRRSCRPSPQREQSSYTILFCRPSENRANELLGRQSCWVNRVHHTLGRKSRLAHIKPHTTSESYTLRGCRASRALVPLQVGTRRWVKSPIPCRR